MAVESEYVCKDIKNFAINLQGSNSGNNSANNGSVIFVVTRAQDGTCSVHQYKINALSGNIDPMSVKSVTGLGEVVGITHIAK